MEDECNFTASNLNRSFVIPNSESERVNVGVQEKSELGSKRKKLQPEGMYTRDPKWQKNKEVEFPEEEASNVTKEIPTTHSNVDKSLKHFALDLNKPDVSSSVASVCESSIGSLERKDPMRVWKEMKQNGFLSSSNVGVIPKPRVQKGKNNRNIKKKMEIAKKEQVDQFAKIAAPSGLLNGLNPGIINHVRNSKQVHSIIEALVRSEKRENRQIRSNKKDLETLNDVGMNKIFVQCNDDDNHESYMVEKINLGGADDNKHTTKSSSTNMLSEITSFTSNEDSGDLTNDTALSVKAANVSFQWLELLHQDIKGRLAALRRSKKRVRGVIQTELPCLMAKEFSSYNFQENDYDHYNAKRTRGGLDDASAELHRARWSSLFNQMERALLEEEKQLESWLNQVKEMQLHCRCGLSQQLGSLDNGYRLEKSDKSERELAISAAAASLYSTCNFVELMENIPCL